MARRRRRRMTRKQARMRRRRIRIAGFCLAGCILIFGIVCGAFHHYVSQFPEDKIAENIYVGTVDLSGLSKKEALEKLAGQKKADQKQTVSLTVEGQKAEATLEECGFDYADVIRKRRRIFWKNGQFHLQSTHRMRPLQKVEADFRLTKRKLERP